MASNPAERRRPTWLRILLFGLLAVGGLAAAAIIVPPMFLTPSSEVAFIKAEPGPFKEKPADPGGAEIPHTDSTVMTDIVVSSTAILEASNFTLLAMN